MKLGCSVVFALLLLLANAGSRNAAAVATTGAAPRSCASALPDVPNDINAAFAYELGSDPILGFLSGVKRASVDDQRRTVAAALAAANSPAVHELEAAEGATCANLDEIYGLTRALSLVANEWKVDDLRDAPRFQQFSAVVSDAIVALALGDRLTPAQRAVALRPFAALDGRKIGATPQRSATACIESSCAAQPVHLVEPEYPSLAGALGSSGGVRILISLSPTGEVRSARYESDDIRGTSYADLVRAAIVAAAATTYVPATMNAHPVPGTFLFDVVFSMK